MVTKGHGSQGGQRYDVWCTVRQVWRLRGTVTKGCNVMMCGVLADAVELQVLVVVVHGAPVLVALEVLRRPCFFFKKAAQSRLEVH